MKKMISILLLAVMALSLVACDFVPTAGHGTPAEDFPLFSIIKVGVVGGESSGYVKRLDEDAYGRILFEFRVANLVSSYYDNGISGYGISQKIEGSEAYYYEDIFYIAASNHTLIDEEAIETLKQTNDWAKEPDKSKPLAKVKSFTNRFEENILDIDKAELQDALSAFGNVLGLNSDELKKYEIMQSCRDADGKTLFYVATGEKNGQDNPSENCKLYAIIIDPDGDASEKSILQIENPYSCVDILRKFKQDNEWNPQR